MPSPLSQFNMLILHLVIDVTLLLCWGSAQGDEDGSSVPPSSGFLVEISSLIQISVNGTMGVCLGTDKEEIDKA